MKTRKDEEFAKEAFSRFLARLGSSHDWCEGSEPPDYFLHIEETSFAVEVTQIVEQVDLGTHVSSTTGVNRALTAFTRRLQTEAVARNILHGSYVIDFSPIPHLKAQQDTIRGKLLEYISTTQHNKTSDWVTTHRVAGWPAIQIRKASGSGAVIYELIGGAEGKWEGDVLSEISQLIQRAIETKAGRLQGVPGDHILVLIDAYHYASAEAWNAVASWPRFLTSSFHSVVRVHGDYQCQILHSRDGSWRDAV